jgi:MFS transporter, MHS family, shikimate and dehydroshikimate transport protein
VAESRTLMVARRCVALWALLLSSGLMAALSSLPGEQFLTWAWRIPFLTGVILLVAGFWMCSRAAETPIFVENRERRPWRRFALIVALRRPG